MSDGTEISIRQGRLGTLPCSFDDAEIPSRDSSEPRIVVNK